jgi:exopolyphosphatase/guanosine-5'-triphosphate,3'-diphosphate pyrophosphatase
VSTARIEIEDSHVRITVAELADLAERSAAREAGTTYLMPIGPLSLNARHLLTDPPQPEDLTNAIGEVLDHIDDAQRELAELESVSAVILIGAVARTVATVEIGGPVAAESFLLTRDAAEDVFRTLATEGADDRRHNPGLPHERLDTIVAGCCVVVALYRGLHLEVTTVDMRELAEVASDQENP